MKKFVLFLLSAFVTFSILAQSPEKMSYQAVIRNSANQLIINHQIGMQLSILQGSISGTAIYIETHTTTSNANGLVTIEIGNGTLLYGNFSTIDWSAGPYFIKTETDPTGGTVYTITGTNQLISVPYALYAKTAESLNGGVVETDPVFGASVAAGITGTDTLFWNQKYNLPALTTGSILFSDGTTIEDDPDNLYWDNNNKRMGVGINNPVSTIDIKSSNSTLTSSIMNLKNYTNQTMLNITGINTDLYIDSLSGSINVWQTSSSSSKRLAGISVNNFSMGYESGISLNGGLYNSFLGFQTGKYTVDGHNNIFIGYQAGFSNISGALNLFIGNKAGYSLTDGNSNIFIGNEAGYNFTDGINNVFIGMEAGRSVNTNVFNNLFVGNSAGRNNISGNYNTYLGIAAGYNGTGNENTMVGNTSGFGNTGSQNTYVGSQSGIYSSSGARNVCIGYKSGYRTTGSGNVFIGNCANNTNFSTVNYSNCVAIGDSLIVSASNQVRLGNNNVTSLYCMGAYNSTTALAANLYVSSTGQIMRNTSSLRYKKDITPLEIDTKKIYKLNPVSYISINDGTHHFGLIAEEVAGIIPELADFAEEKDVIPGSNSDKLIPDAVQYPLLSVLILKELQNHENTLQNQQKQIEDLNKSIEELKEVNRKMMELLNKLQAE